MTRWRIESRTSGHDLGVWDGPTAEDAHDAMARAAGYRDRHDAATATGDDGAHLVFTEVVPTGYVVTGRGKVLLQVPHESAPGFALADDDQQWPGGHGAAAGEWELVADDDPRVTEADRERLGDLLEWYRDGSYERELAEDAS